jgi:hypothetical protein
MKSRLLLAGIAAGALLVGCATPLPPGAERGPDGTIAYTVLIDASPPGARIEANGADIGGTPVRLKIFGDPDGTFHDFGSEVYVIRALPIATNQFAQVRTFGTGHMFGPEDRIPDRIVFDMNQPSIPYGPAGPPAYAYPAYPPP